MNNQVSQSVSFRVSLRGNRATRWPSSGRWDFSTAAELRLVEWFVDGSSVFIKTSGNDLAAALHEFDGQLSDGLFENEPVTAWKQIAPAEYDARRAEVVR